VAGEDGAAAIEALAGVALRVEGVEGARAAAVAGEQAVGAEGVDSGEAVSAPSPCLWSVPAAARGRPDPTGRPGSAKESSVFDGRLAAPGRELGPVFTRGARSARPPMSPRADRLR
jgi:hypothetical protein